MENSKIIATPMLTSCYLDKDEDKKQVEESKYRCMIGYLLYLNALRHDIIFDDYMCACFQASAKESHLSAVKCIMRYLPGISQGSDCDLIGHSDSDFVRCKLDRKSTSGVCHKLGNSLVSWHIKKQVSVALSTIEAE